jgi:LmbE family N-acetylglucosaminyl deacetylase
MKSFAQIFTQARNGVFLLIVLLHASVTVLAQKKPHKTASEILHEMKKLNVLGSVLYMAAHPDDESTRLLAYLARERQYRTGYMAMTRGDGGQNLIGNEQGFELGLIRTQELLAARRIDGAEQFFSRAFDFGFSKRTDEALATWNEEKVLADAVWVIRNFKPDIIITRFPEDSRAGHGHHSGSAVIARKAFLAAADPNRFPEQLKNGVTVWQAKRIMWNTFSFGNSNTTSENQMKIEVGGYLPLLGKSIGEIAAESRSQHRSQGFGSASSRGTATEYFVHTLGEKATKDPMEGVDDSWNRVAGGAAIKAAVDALVTSYKVADPSASLPQLLSIYAMLNTVGDAYWRNQKKQDVEQLVLAVAGLHLEALADKQMVKQGDSCKVSVNIINRSSAAVSLKGLQLNSMSMEFAAPLSPNTNFSQTLTVAVSPNHPVSQPYWLANPMNTGHFNVFDQQLIGKAQNDPAFTTLVELNVMGQTIAYRVPVMHRIVDPAIGEFFHPVIVVPPVTIPQEPLPVLVKGNAKDASASTPAKTLPPVMHTINYEHIPRVTYFSNAEPKVIRVDLKTAGKKVGYIVGAGDKVPAMIELMGFQVMELEREDITAEKLKQFDAVVVGVRAYNVNDWMNEKYDLLMNYVRNGGNMVVQYNTNSFAGPLQKMQIGPKPFMISRGRTTEEDAAITFLAPEDPVLNFPNKITAEDFKGWIQERGIYYADNFDQDYKAILSMHDQGEADLKGSLIVRQEGKGRFIYTGLVFFRELPAGVPGAFRLFANLISNPNKQLNESK